MHKYIMLTLIIAGSVLGLVYTFVAVIEAEKNKVEPPAENELRITATNWAFDQEEYTVEQGETMTLTLHNAEGKHTALIEGLDVELMEGQPVEVTFDQPGTYTIRCNLLCGPGHAEMVSTLIVK